MHPVLFSIGTFYIGTYGLMLALALIAGTFVAVHQAKRAGFDSQTVMDLIFFGVVGGLAGGRGAHILVNFGLFLEAPSSMIFSRTGFVFLGSVVGALAVVLLIARRRRLEFWRLSDVLVAAVALGHALGRVGCFLAGCCYGRVADPDGPLAFLAVQYPKEQAVGSQFVGSPACADHVAHLGLSPVASHSLPVWPVQLFESLGNLAIFGLLLLLWPRRRFEGQVFLLYLTLYASLRFALECLRGDAERGAIGPFSTSQALSLFALVCVAVCWRYRRRSGAIGRVVRARAGDGPPRGAEKRRGS